MKTDMTKQIEHALWVKNRKAVVLESMVRSLNREVSKLYKLNPIWESEEVANE